jgi:hypothetical protein
MLRIFAQPPPERRDLWAELAKATGAKEDVWKVAVNTLLPHIVVVVSLNYTDDADF